MTTNRATPSTEAGDVMGLLTSILIEDYGVAPESIGPSAGISELGLDSLDLIESLVALEDRLGVDLGIDEAFGPDIDTLGALVQVVSEHIGSAV